MSSIAIIPARGGSKRIPRKNIKDFLGKSIIAYSIEAALQSKLFDEVMVSTDDKGIAEIAVKYGASVPFLRSKSNADDYATTADVILEVLESYKLEKKAFDYVCCIYPTAPFISTETLQDSFNLLVNGNFSTIFPVIKFGYPIQRSLSEKDGNVAMVWPEHLKSRSQDLEPRYHDAGQFYWLNTNEFEKSKALFGDNSGFFEVDELQVQDIDNEVDWKLAELKFQLLDS